MSRKLCRPSYSISKEALIHSVDNKPVYIDAPHSKQH